MDFAKNVKQIKTQISECFLLQGLALKRPLCVNEDRRHMQMMESLYESQLLRLIDLTDGREKRRDSELIVMTRDTQKIIDHMWNRALF